MKLVKTVFIGALLCSLSVAANAHWLFAYPQAGGKAKLELADAPGFQLAPMLNGLMPKMKNDNIKEWIVSGDNKSAEAVLIDPTKPATSDVSFGIYKEFLLHWSCKVASDLKAAGMKTKLPCDISVVEAHGGHYAFVTRNGKDMVGAEVSIYLPGQKEAVVAKTAERGAVKLPTLPKGIVSISAIVITAESGELNGTPYKDKRDYATLSVEIK